MLQNAESTCLVLKLKPWREGKLKGGSVEAFLWVVVKHDDVMLINGAYLGLIIMSKRFWKRKKNPTCVLYFTDPRTQSPSLVGISIYRKVLEGHFVNKMSTSHNVVLTFLRNLPGRLLVAKGTIVGRKQTYNDMKHECFWLPTCPPNYLWPMTLKYRATVSCFRLHVFSRLQKWMHRSEWFWMRHKRIEYRLLLRERERELGLETTLRLSNFMLN